MQNKFLGILAHSSQKNPGYATVYLLPPANEAPSVHGGRGCQGRSASRGVCLGGSASRAGGVCIPGGSASRAGGVCIQGVCLGGSASRAGGVCIPGGGLHPGKEGSASRGGSASHGGVCLEGSASRAGGVCIPRRICIPWGVCLEGSASRAGRVCIQGGTGDLGGMGRAPQSV